MMIRYWQPFREIETLRRQLDHVFDEITHSQGDAPGTWGPAIEMQDDGDNLILKVQLPGVEGKDLDVQVTRDGVAIAGDRPQPPEQTYLHSEFRYGKFQRVINLPVAVQNDQVSASLTNGILTLTLPKVTEARNRVFKVNLGELSDAATQTLEASTNSVVESSSNQS
jgi:HSP20 family protein